MVRPCAILVAFCLLMVSPRALAAQESPEAFARRFADVAKRGDWQAYSQMMHPDALAALKKIFAEALSGATSGETVRKVFGVSNATEFEALPDALVFVRLFAILEKNVPNFQSVVRSAAFEALGSIPEGEFAHVVVRTGTKMEQSGISRTSVMSLKRHEGEWKALLSTTLEGLARQIANARMVAPPK